jgi:hypothetical protein
MANTLLLPIELTEAERLPVLTDLSAKLTDLEGERGMSGNETRPPDLEGMAGRKAWRVRTGEPPTGLAGFVVQVPGAHAWWDKWFVSMIHLRDVAGMAPAKKQFSEATHEFLILALNPEFPVDLDHPSAHYLTPVDVVEQFGGVTDDDAISICEGAVIAILRGVASPDQDYRAAWKALIKNTVEHIALGGHAKEST